MGLANRHILDILTALRSPPLSELWQSQGEVDQRLARTVNRCFEETKDQLVSVHELVEEEKSMERVIRLGIRKRRASRLRKLYAKTKEIEERLKAAVDRIKSWRTMEARERLKLRD